MKRLFYFAVISILVLIFSCQTRSDLGLNILPEDDLLNAEIIDTFSVEVYTASSDTIETDGVSQFLLGEHTDPVFGISKASFVCQFGLSELTNWPAYLNGFSSRVPDSAVLTIIADTTELEFYGDLSSQQTISVYRIGDNSDLFDTATYYHTHDPSEYLNGELLGEAQFTLNADSDTIEILLDQSFAQDVIDEDPSTFLDSESLLDFFKGIYVKAEFENDEGYLYKLNAAESFITVFFKENPDIVQNPDSGSILFIQGESGIVRFNMYEHDYTGVAFENSIDNEDVQDSVAYIQGLGGVTSKIYIPYLENLSSLNDFVIYRAELVIKTAPSAYTLENTYEALPELTLSGYDPETEYDYLPEYTELTTAGLIYYGEAYDENEYRFEIGAYIRKILEGETENNGFWLFPTPGKSHFERSVITTGLNSDAIKLYITLQKL